nr:activating signal cointegrator 1 complex subunit 2 homolog [Procambarus clarkii]
MTKVHKEHNKTKGSVGERPSRHRGYSIYSGITTSGGSGRLKRQDTENVEPDLEGWNTAAEEAGEAGTAGGGCQGGNPTSDKAGDTEEMAEDVWGSITTADETGDGAGDTEPSERAVFFNTTTRFHVHSQPCKGEPPPTGNRNHPTRATCPKQEVPAPHESPPPQQEPHQSPHYPPDPHQHHTHHPRTPQRNSSQKKHQPSPHPHIPLPTNEEAKHLYPYANAWGQAVDHWSCHPLQEAPERSRQQAAPQPG